MRTATLLLFLFAARAIAQNAELPKFTPGKSDVVFKQSPDIAEKLQVKLRFSAKEDPGDYDVSKEKFQIVVPKTYNHKTPHGLFVWINAGDNPTLPPVWLPILEKHKLIAIGAYKSGNTRNIFDRFRMAIDANFNMQQRFNIDPKRVYASGFSGGARTAGMLAVAYADIFSGAVPMCGVNFYKPVPLGDGKMQGIDFIPADQVLEHAKPNGRYVLLTGSKDFNKPGTKAVFEHGFKAEGFKYAWYLEVPDMGHSPAPADWLDKALDLLDGKTK